MATRYGQGGYHAGRRLTQKPPGMSDFDWDSHRFGKPDRQVIDGITMAYFPGQHFPTFYGGDADKARGLYGNRLSVHDSRVAAINNSRDLFRPTPHHSSAPRPAINPAAPHRPEAHWARPNGGRVVGHPYPGGAGRDTGLLGADSNALGGYQTNHRTYDPKSDITTVRFNDSGYVGRYGNHGTVRLSLSPPPNADRNSHAWRYVTDIARQRNAGFIANAQRHVNDVDRLAPLKSVLSLDGAPKDWMGVARNIQQGTQDVADWLQYGTAPGFHLNPTDAERKQWHDQWLRQQISPGLADFGDRVAGDVPQFLTAPAVSVAVAGQYEQNSRDAARHDLLARTSTDPRAAAQHRAEATRLRQQNQQIVSGAKEGVGLGKNGIFTRTARAVGDIAGGQPGMAMNEVRGAVRDTVGYAMQHPLLFLSNLDSIRGGFALSRDAINGLSSLGASGVERLSAKALADARVETNPVVKAQLLDGAAKYQDIATQMRAGKPLSAIRIAGARGTNAEHMPPQVPGRVAPVRPPSAPWVVEPRPSTTSPLSGSPGVRDVTGPPPIGRPGKVVNAGASAKAGASAVLGGANVDPLGFEGAGTAGQKVLTPKSSLGELLGYPWDGSEAPPSSPPITGRPGTGMNIGASAQAGASSVSGVSGASTSNYVGKAGAKSVGVSRGSSGAGAMATSSKLRANGDFSKALPDILSPQQVRDLAEDFGNETGYKVIFNSDDAAAMRSDHFDPITKEVHFIGGPEDGLGMGLVYEELGHGYDDYYDLNDTSLSDHRLHANTAENIINNQFLPTTPEHNVTLQNLANSLRDANPKY